MLAVGNLGAPIRLGPEAKEGDGGKDSGGSPSLGLSSILPHEAQLLPHEEYAENGDRASDYSDPSGEAGATHFAIRSLVIAAQVKSE